MAERTWSSGWLGRSGWRRWTVATGAFFLCYTLFGFFLLPALLRGQLEKRLSQTLHRPVSIREIKINPYTLQVAVNGFAVREPDGQVLFSFDGLRINLQAVSAFKRALIIKSFSLINPYGRLVFNQERRFNVADLFAAPQAGEEKKEKEQESGLLFSINNIELSGGRIDFLDQVRKVSHRVEDMHVTLPFLSNFPAYVTIYTQPALTATVNGRPLSIQGASIPFYHTRQSELHIQYADLDLTQFEPYLPDNLQFSLKHGLLDLDLALSFLEKEDGTPSLTLRGRAGLREFVAEDRRQQPLLAFPELAVELEEARIFQHEFHLSRVFWKQPELYVERRQNGRFSLAELVGVPGERRSGQGGAGAALPLLEVADAAIEAGTVHFADQTVATPFQTTLQPVNLQVKDFSTRQNSQARYSLALTSDRGERLKADGVLSLAPLQLAAQLRLESGQLASYRPYYEKYLQGELAAERLNAQAHLDYGAAGDAPLLSALQIEVSGFTAAWPNGRDKIVVPQFLVSGATVDVHQKRVTVESCVSRGGSIPLTKRRTGEFTLRDFLVPPETAEAASVQTGSTGEGSAAWQVVVKQVDFSDYRVSFTDQTPARPVVLEATGLHLTAGNVSNRPGEKCTIDLGLQFNQTGKVRLSGTASLSPLEAKLAIDLADLPLPAVQPYLDGSPLQAVIENGQAGAKGVLAIGRQAEGKIDLSYQGEINSQHFLCLDKHQGRLLGWDKLLARDLQVKAEPWQIAAGEVLLEGADAKVQRSEKGVLNVSTLVAEKPAGKSPQQAGAAGHKPGSELGLQVSQIRLERGRVDFTDRSVSPPFHTTLEEMKGVVKGLATTGTKIAKVEMTAVFDRHSPVKLTGFILPWHNFYTDFTAAFSDVELSPASPYSLKYIGYPLTKGKLDLNMHYLVKGGQLTAENQVALDRLTLGDYVENPTAVKLPIQLAIALLKNRQGEINVTIPVSGRLDDPQFSVVRVFFKAVYNLLVKAVTSPFSLLGSIFEGGGEQRLVHFAPGLAAIHVDDQDMLTKLAKVLYDRPAVKVELTGRSDPAVDRPQLKEQHFEHLLKVQKMQELAGKEAPVTEADTLELASAEYDHYLKMAYRAAEFERPRNFLGLLKELPPAEMKKLLYEHIVITDDELRNLASQRAEAVREWLIEQGPVEPERIFLVEPRIGAMEKGEEGIGVVIKVK